jgi:hypothetical protein
MQAQIRPRIAVTASIILTHRFYTTGQVGIDGACFKIISSTRRNGFVTTSAGARGRGHPRSEPAPAGFLATAANALGHAVELRVLSVD